MKKVWRCNSCQRVAEGAICWKCLSYANYIQIDKTDCPCGCQQSKETK